MEQKNIQRDGQDFEFVVSVPIINEEPFNVQDNEWDLSIIGSKSSAKVSYREGVPRSIGDIGANVEIIDGNILIYCKSSKRPFGVGNLSVEMTIYAPHEKFEDEVQVLKTLKESININLV